MSLASILLMRDKFLNINLVQVAHNLSIVIWNFTSFITWNRIDETVLVVDELFPKTEWSNANWKLI